MFWGKPESAVQTSERYCAGRMGASNEKERNAKKTELRRKRLTYRDLQSAILTFERAIRIGYESLDAGIIPSRVEPHKRVCSDTGLSVYRPLFNPSAALPTLIHERKRYQCK